MVSKWSESAILFIGIICVSQGTAAENNLCFKECVIIIKEQENKILFLWCNFSIKTHLKNAGASLTDKAHTRQNLFNDSIDHNTRPPTLAIIFDFEMKFYNEMAVLINLNLKIFWLKC